MFNRSSLAMIPVAGLNLWPIGQRRIFLLIHCRFPPEYRSCLMPPPTILHGAPALAELSVPIGALDPVDRRTQATLIPIVEMLTRINPSRIIAPSYEVWLEASVIAGILARTQAIPKQDRRKFLNGTLLFLQAADTGSVMISRNSRDLDLLLQLKPQAGVLLYDKS